MYENEQALIDADFKLTTNVFHSGQGNGKVYGRSVDNVAPFDDRNVEGGKHYEYFSVAPNGDVAEFHLNANVKADDSSEADGKTAQTAKPIDADAKTVAAVDEMIDHEVTQEDLDNNAELVTAGVKVGDIIKLPKDEFDEDEEELTDEEIAKNKAANIGTVCNLADGTEGVLDYDPDGSSKDLVCFPKEPAVGAEFTLPDGRTFVSVETEGGAVWSPKASE